jgi:hypothetical protein
MTLHNECSCNICTDLEFMDERQPDYRKRLADFIRRHSKYSYRTRYDQVSITLPRVEWEIISALVTLGAKTGARNYAITGEMIEHAEADRLEGDSNDLKG